MKKIIYILLFVLVFQSCRKDEDDLTASKEDLFPVKTESVLDLELRKIYGDYNTVIVYRYIKNFLPTDWYRITPMKEELVIPMAHFLFDYWVTPLELASNKAFVSKNFPKKIVYVGSPAYNLDGSRVLGQAEGGTLIRYTECNDLDLTNKSWMTMQLHTAYHEYGHILHQTFKMPDEYRKVTPNNYTKNGWRAISKKNAIERGMLTPYGTNGVADDFCELFAGYITYSDTALASLLEDEEITGLTDPVAIGATYKRNEGRQFIRLKLSIMKKFLMSAGIDLDIIRTELQKKLK